MTAQLRRLTAVALLAGSLAACGTTVPLSSRANGAQGSSGLGDELLPSATEGPTSSAQLPATASSAGGTTLPNGGGAIGPTGPATGGSTVRSSVNGRGVTATTVTIGAAIPTGTGPTYPSGQNRSRICSILAPP